MFKNGFITRNSGLKHLSDRELSIQVLKKNVEKSSYPVEPEGKKNSMHPLEKSIYPLEKEKTFVHFTNKQEVEKPMGIFGYGVVTLS